MLVGIIACQDSTQTEKSPEIENTSDEDSDKIIELNIVDDIVTQMTPVYDEIERLGYYEDTSQRTLFWGDFTFNLPFNDYEIQLIELDDHQDKKISKIHNGVIYRVSLSNYGEEMINDQDFDTGFLYYRHKGQTDDADILKEVKYAHISKNSPAIYSCFSYELNGKEYFEDLMTIKHNQYIFEMSVVGSPLHENYRFVKDFFDSFILL